MGVHQSNPLFGGEENTAFCPPPMAWGLFGGRKISFSGPVLLPPSVQTKHTVFGKAPEPWQEGNAAASLGCWVGFNWF